MISLYTRYCLENFPSKNKNKVKMGFKLALLVNRLIFSTSRQPTSAEELLGMLEFGNNNRTQHPTDANAQSSRSHAVFQVNKSIFRVCHKVEYKY